MMRRQNEATSVWRFFPWFVTAGMALVFAANGVMIWSAIATFPGKAGRDGFELSNRYDAVLARAQDQARIGWTVNAATDDKRRPVLTLVDPQGAPLIGAIIEGSAERPVGDPMQTTIVFGEKAGGRYVADIALDARGQWDVTFSARANGRTLTATRRIVVP